MKKYLFYFTLFLSVHCFSQKNGASWQVSTFEIDSPELNSKKKIWVYLPKTYHLKNKQNFSVIYMHDAQHLFDNTTAKTKDWNVDETLDSLNAKVIVIGIEHNGDNRLDELTLFKNVKYGSENGDNYLDFIVQTLKPYIDQTYRTKSDKRNTAIIGSVLGGLISYYAILKYPHVFGKAGVFSPSFCYNSDIYELTKKTKKLKAKIYFLCGDDENDDMLPNLKKMVYLVDSIRCHCLALNYTEVIKGAQQNEKLWREHFKQAYLWLF